MGLSWGRIVAVIVLPDGRVLNEELVRAGLAWWFVRYAKNDARLQQLEAEARRENRGLWVQKEPVAPWEWRKRGATAHGASPR